MSLPFDKISSLLPLLLLLLLLLMPLPCEVGDGNGLQLLSISLVPCKLDVEDVSGLSGTFLRFELPRRIFKLDFLEGAGDAAVIVISIFISCSSSPDCSTHVGRTAEPVGECFVEPESFSVKGLFLSDFVMNVGRSRKILSSSAFNEPNTDGGVK
jgi:hypothetical protein